jgi:hypothetical protein
LQKKIKMSTVPSGTRFIGIAENVNLTERKSAVLNTETQPYTIQDIADTVGVGAQGPQGVQGPAGPLGPVGPAGLNWQGAWVSGTSYVADDAVGYGGASYFCILATSGTTTPNLATTNWALLASQGVQGIQGVQGPTGAQGASGGAATKTNGTMSLTTADSPRQTLSYDINRINLNGSSSVHLPAAAPIGKEISVFLEVNAGVNLVIYGDNVLNLSFPFLMGSANQQTGIFTIFDSESYVFTSLGNGLWKVNTISRTIMSGSAAKTATSSSTINGSSVSVQHSSNLDSVVINTNNVRFGKNSGGLKTITLQLPTSVSANRIQSLPDADGTLALTSDITLQQTVDNGNTIIDSFGSKQTIYANINRFDNLTDGTYGIYGLGLFNKGDGTNFQNIQLPEIITGGIKTITFPNATGTVALTNQLPAVSGNYANDAAAAVAGIAIGSLYHTGGVVKIRLT